MEHGERCPHQINTPDTPPCVEICTCGHPCHEHDRVPQGVSGPPIACSRCSCRGWEGPDDAHDREIDRVTASILDGTDPHEAVYGAPRGRTTVDKLTTVPIPLAKAYGDARRRGLVPPMSEVLAEALERNLRDAGIDPPPRPVANPQTSKATEARWKSKRPQKTPRKG